MPDADLTTTLPFPVLVGDIGGTNARFAIVPDREAPLEVFHSVATGDFRDIETAIEEAVFPYTQLRPRSSLVDIAGPIVGDAVDLTNAAWVIRPRDMIARLGVEDVILLNDFEALALALTALSPDDLVKIGGGDATPTGAKVVLGPGTGLGVGGLVNAGGGRVTRVHGPFVTDQEVERVCAALKAQGDPRYVHSITEDEDVALGIPGFDEPGEQERSEDEDLYTQAVDMVRREGRVSTSLVQRHLQIGYNRAARLVERMQKEGLISAPDRTGKREIL